MRKPFFEETEKNRLETFIDATLAIVMTILVLEFKVPEQSFSSDSEIKSFILHLLPSLFSYSVSFITIVVLWIDHHFLFKNIKQADSRFVLLNFLFILFLSAIPFTTALAGRNYESSFAVAMVATNYALMNLAFIFLWLYAQKTKMLSESVLKSKVSKQDKFLSSAGFLVTVASIPFAYINTYITFSLFIVVVLMHLTRHLFS